MPRQFTDTERIDWLEKHQSKIRIRHDPPVGWHLAFNNVGHDRIIPICFSHGPGAYNLEILSPKDRKRLIFRPLRMAKYLLTVEMGKPYLFSGKEFYSDEVKGVKVSSVYALDHEAEQARWRRMVSLKKSSRSPTVFSH